MPRKEQLHTCIEPILDPRIVYFCWHTFHIKLNHNQWFSHQLHVLYRTRYVQMYWHHYYTIHIQRHTIITHHHISSLRRNCWMMFDLWSGLIVFICYVLWKRRRETKMRKGKSGPISYVVRTSTGEKETSIHSTLWTLNCSFVERGSTVSGAVDVGPLPSTS